MIYHKIQYIFKFYLQIFTGAQCGFLTDVPSVNDFVPYPMNHVRIYSRNLFSCPSPQFFQTCRKMWNKNLVFNVSPHRKVQGC